MKKLIKYKRSMAVAILLLMLFVVFITAGSQGDEKSKYGYTVYYSKKAVTHINTYGSHHTDCILTEDKDRAAYFTTMVDSASVYVNASTRFADGFRYGFGAEVGISTGKIHARGPVGLDGLITYKYNLEGDGEIVADYASGEKKFHHKDL